MEKITQDHIKLLEKMYVGHCKDSEFGAPVVDPKRPYGNSDVYSDIAEILEIEYNDDLSYDEISEKQRQMNKIHEEMHMVIQLIFENPDLAPVEHIGKSLETKFDRWMKG